MEESSVIIKNNKLVVTKNGVTEELTIYDNKLSSKFKILNYLFTLQKSYIPQNPSKILPETEYTTSYISFGTPINCDYLIFNETRLQPFPLSMAVPPRREIIQLFRNDYIYNVKYKTNRKIQFLNLISHPDNRAYPLVDSKGNTLKCVGCEGYFTTAFWSLIIVRLCDGESRKGLKVELEVTAVKHVTPIASVTGDICLSIKTKHFGVISVKVAMKFTTPNSIQRVPVPELEQLASLLYVENRIQVFDPCFDLPIVVDPIGPFLSASFPVDPPSEVTIQFIDDVILHGGFRPGGYGQLVMPDRIVNNLAAKVGNLITLPTFGQVSTAMWLYARAYGTFGVPYVVTYRVELIFRGGGVPDLQTPAFWLASQNGLYYTEYNSLCDMEGSTTLDKNSEIIVDSEGNVHVTFANSYRFSTSCGNYFMIGFYPGIFNNGYPFTVNVSPGSFITVKIDDNERCNYGYCFSKEPLINNS